VTTKEMDNHGGRLLEAEYPNPNMNLALDHAIAKLHTGRDPDYLTVRFWRNPSCVVLGRGQNPEEEVDMRFCRENEIAVCRRVSGGGTVYQDPGNVNVSLFLPREDASDRIGIHGASAELTDLLAESLRACGVSRVERVGPYSVFSEGKKVSGAASYFTRTALLHHATLLISADLSRLEGSLIHHSPPFRRGASRYSATKNLTDLPIELWERTLVGSVSEHFGAKIIPGEITAEENALALNLFESKYSKESWTMGAQ